MSPRPTFEGRFKPVGAAAGKSAGIATDVGSTPVAAAQGAVMPDTPQPGTPSDARPSPYDDAGQAGSAHAPASRSVATVARRAPAAHRCLQ